MTTLGDIPTGWAVTSVGAVAKYQNGRAFKPSEWKETGLPIIRIQNLNDATAAFNCSDRSHEQRFKVKNGDLLFAWSASLGAYIWRGQEAWLNQHIFRVDHCSEIDRLFLYYALTNITSELYAKAHGSGMVHVTKAKFEETLFLLPPLNEQRRIVAKIDKLFSELDEGVESLKMARAQLKVYRQAVLKHAFEGKLTARWRNENKDKLETPEQLLGRVERNRKARYEEQLKEWKSAVTTWEDGGNSGRKPPKPPKLKEIPSVTLSEFEALPCLPVGWTYLRLGIVIDAPRYGTSKKCDYEYEGTGVLRIPNVVHGVVDASDLKRAKFDEAEQRQYGLTSGDILIIRSNGSISIVGRCALVSKAEEQYLYAGYLIRLRSNPATMQPECLFSVLSSHLIRTQIEHKAKSTSGVNNINSGEIQSLVIPYCNLHEQRVVVEYLSERLSTLVVAEAEIDSQLRKANTLRQSILKKAFSGELVKQDPCDEPAAILLERIKAEKASQKPRAKTRQRRVANA